MWEKELLGLYISGNPLEKYRDMLEAQTTQIKKITADLNGTSAATRSPFDKYIISGEEVTIGGIVSNVKKIMTKKGEQMMFVKVQDLTDTIEVVGFPSILESNPYAFMENKILSITGRTDIRDGNPKIIAGTVEEILEA